MKSEIPTNAYYGGLNRRFDRRCRFLLRFGFRMTETAMERRRPDARRPASVPRSALMHADNRAWREVILPMALSR